MKKILSKILLFFFSFQFISCETIVEDLDPKMFSDISEKLVMTSFICPQDSMIFVKLTISTPLFGKIVRLNEDSQKNAFVTIGNSSKFIQLPFLSKENAYGISTKQFKIEAGKTYTLKAKTDKMEVEATTTVPLESPKIDRYTIKESLVIRKIFNGQNSITNDTLKNYEAIFYWKDLNAFKNYYKIEAILSIEAQVPSVANNMVVYKPFMAQYQIRWNDDNYPSTKSYLMDTDNSQNEFKSSRGDLTNFGGFQKGITFNGQNYPTKINSSNDKIYVFLSNLSKEFYDYAISLAAFSSAKDNPFAEPAPVFSNVKNGLGCFAGYNKSELIINPKK